MNELDFEGFFRDSVTGSIHSLNHLQLKPIWSEIYQIENGDAANGGEKGLANLQAIELGNRTEYLFNAVKRIVDYLNSFEPNFGNRIQIVESSNPITSKLQIQYTQPVSDNFDVKLFATFDDGQKVNLLDGLTQIEAEGRSFVLTGGNPDPLISLPVLNPPDIPTPTPIDDDSFSIADSLLANSLDVETLLSAEWSDYEGHANQGDVDTLLASEWTDYSTANSLDVATLLASEWTNHDDVASTVDIETLLTAEWSSVNSQFANDFDVATLLAAEWED